MSEKLKSYKETQYNIRILELEKRVLELEKRKNCSTPLQKIQNGLDFYNEDILDENDFNYHKRIFK